MRALLLIASVFFLLGTAQAMACSCEPDTDGKLAKQTLDNPSVSVVEVYVRGMNMHNHQSMLQLTGRKYGGLMAQNIRAKFGADSCAVVPQYKKNMTVIIKAEDDGTYSIMGDCAHTAVMDYLNKGN